MLENKRFGVISLGCDKNRVDSEKLLGRIREKGYTLTSDPEKAHVLIINTCGFLQSARQEAIETVLEFASYKEKNLQKIVVTGCLPEKFIGELFDGLTEGDVFLGINDYDELFDALEKSYRTGERINAVGKGVEQFKKERVLTTDPHIAYLKIADGCYNHCTYCLIPKIRGKYRSYAMDKLVEEAEELGDISELVLVAQDSTRYGEDLYGENKFVALIQKLSALENIRTIRLLYCYPEVVSDELIREMKENPKLLKYMDIPLQHSETRILKLMNRKGTRESYLNLFEKLRREIPEIAIRSTFISGFPTETEEEFQALQDFLQQAKLVNCGFFAYSREPDTAAARLKGQIHHATKARRVKRLYETQRSLSERFLNGFVGKTITVLCDGIDYEKSCFVGRSYFSAPDIDGKVYFNAANAIQGEFYQVKIKKADAYDLFGETEDYPL